MCDSKTNIENMEGLTKKEKKLVIFFLDKVRYCADINGERLTMDYIDLIKDSLKVGKSK